MIQKVCHSLPAPHVCNACRWCSPTIIHIVIFGEPRSRANLTGEIAPSESTVELNLLLGALVVGKHGNGNHGLSNQQCSRLHGSTKCSKCGLARFCFFICLYFVGTFGSHSHLIRTSLGEMRVNNSSHDPAANLRAPRRRVAWCYRLVL